LPYLQGYVVFYARDYAEALQALNRAPENDPFIVCLLAQTYEGLGDHERAEGLCRRAAAAIAHSVAAAYAQPFARQKLATLSGDLQYRYQS
jgi:hypothetical protein